MNGTRPWQQKKEKKEKNLTRKKQKNQTSIIYSCRGQSGAMVRRKNADLERRAQRRAPSECRESVHAEYGTRSR
jgi:hypothetical protein